MKFSKRTVARLLGVGATIFALVGAGFLHTNVRVTGSGTGRSGGHTFTYVQHDHTSVWIAHPWLAVSAIVLALGLGIAATRIRRNPGPAACSAVA